ncbi:hypothetical protein L7F22_051250 [Adiantum nelumboides]|nr:hypothetical protein [Adiantum nelumboides]
MPKPFKTFILEALLRDSGTGDPGRYSAPYIASLGVHAQRRILTGVATRSRYRRQSRSGHLQSCSSAGRGSWTGVALGWELGCPRLPDGDCVLQNRHYFWQGSAEDALLPCGVKPRMDGLTGCGEEAVGPMFLVGVEGALFLYEVHPLGDDLTSCGTAGGCG